MAQRSTVLLHDDLTGGKAAETVKFAIDGKTYEIDLNKRNAAALRKVIGTYISAGRRAARPARRRRSASKAPTSKPSTRAGRASSTPAQSQPSHAEIRAWAMQQGIEIAARGRISNATRDQYLAAQRG